MLVIDDDVDIRETVQAVLELEGYRAIAISDGAAALAWLRSGVPPPCLILLDLMMPGMNGIQFRTEQLGDPKLAELPVVIISGAGDAADEQAFALRAELLKKPFALGPLLSTVRRHWSRASPSAGPAS